MKALLALSFSSALLVVLISCVPLQAPDAGGGPSGATELAAASPMAAGTTITATAVPTATVVPTLTVTVTPTMAVTTTVVPTEEVTPTVGPTTVPTSVPAESPTTEPSPTASATHVPTEPPTPTVAPTPTPTEGPPPTPTPLPSTVFVRNDRGYREGSSYVVVGEVVNGSPGEVYNVKIIATFFDAASQLVGAQEVMAFLPQTVPTQANPFRVQLPNAPGSVAHYELTLTWDELTIATYGRVTVTREEVRQENGLTLTGDLRNDHRSDIRNIVVVATFYDDQGLVQAVLPGSTGLNVLPPGGETTFTISSPQAFAYSSYLVQTGGLLLP